MKTCSICGTKADSNAVTCSACGEGSFTVSASQAAKPPPAVATAPADNGLGSGSREPPAPDVAAPSVQRNPKRGR